MKKIVGKTFLGAMIDSKAIIEFLEKQAREGLMLVGIIGPRFYFEKSEKKDVKFALEYEKVEKSKNIESLECVRLYKENQWDYICSNGKSHIFCTDVNNTREVKINQEEKFNRILKLGVIPEMVALFAVLLFMMMSSILDIVLSPEETGIEELFINNFGSLGYAYVYVLLSIIYGIIRISGFYKINKKRIANNEELFYYDIKQCGWARVVQVVLVIGVIIGLVYDIFFKTDMNLFFNVVYVGSFVIIGAVVYAFYKKGVINKTWNSKKSIAVIIVACIGGIMLVLVFPICAVMFNVPLMKSERCIKYKADGEVYEYVIEESELPLITKDFDKEPKGKKYQERMKEESKSIFGYYLYGDESNYDKEMQLIDGYLGYEIIKSDFEFILNSYEKRQLEINKSWESNIKKDKKLAKKFKANKVYRIGYEDGEEFEDVIIVYDDCIVYFMTDCIEYNEKNIDLIYNTLVK